MANEALFDVAQVLKTLKGARERPASFAVGDGGTPDKALLVVDRQKTGEQLFALIKKEGLTKGFWGTVTCDGSRAVFVSDKPASGQKKLLEGWFRKNKLSMKPVIGDDTDPGTPPDTGEKTPEAGPVKPPSGEARAAPGREADAESGGEAESDEDEAGEDTPAGSIFSAEVIKAQLARAKTRPVFFAFGRGRTAGENLLALHPKRAGTKLALLIKKENGAAKGNFGTVSVTSSTATFACEKEPISGLKKMIRALLKAWELNVKVVIVGPGGVVEEPDDEADDDGSAGTAADPVDEAARLAALRQQLDAALPGLKAVFVARPDRADDIRAVYRACDGAVKAGDAGQAAALLARLTVLASDDDPESRALTDLRRERDELLPVLKAAAAGQTERTATIREQWRVADEALKRRDATMAATALARLRELASPVTGASPGDGDAGMGQDPAADPQAAAFRAQWAAMRERLQAEGDRVAAQFAALQATLLKYDDGDLTRISKTGIPPVAEDVARFVAALVAEIGIAADAPAAAYQRAAAAALKQTATLRHHLDSEDRITGCDSNPFNVKVAVKATLGEVLDALEPLLQRVA
ncbi:MAG: hypothetical protein P4M00_16380 [Azospirillaceae bacterium]|nr:hypothetical protein [Azospirillaceae bacterium]